MPGNGAPVFTIQVGIVGTYSYDPYGDVSSYVNSQIALAPAGDQIVINFEPGVYGVVKPMLLPSNTTVIGDDATLKPLTYSGWQGNTGIFVNADAYSLNGTQTYVKNTDGTASIINATLNNSTVMAPGSLGVVDTNISVQGITFDDRGYWVFGTWFTNAANIDVQNNTYIGGADGNAFVDVVNGLVANNLAIGQVNAAYDNWDGPTNTVIEDNSTYMYGAPTCGWSVLINSCPSGNPANPGNASNDGVVDNTFSGYWINGSSGNADPLQGCGYTTESAVTQQGNLISALNVPEAGSYYSADIVSKDVIQDELFSGINFLASDVASVICALSSSESLASSAQIMGNLILGASNEDNGAPLIVNQGINPTTSNNAVLGGNTAGDVVSVSSLGGTSSTAGNISSSGTSVSGIGVLPCLDVGAPPSLLMNPGSSTLLANLSVVDPVPGDLLSATISALFGTLSSVGAMLGAVTWGSTDDVESVTLTGGLAEIDADFAGLSYASPSNGWDDSIEINVSNEAGASAVRYVPVQAATATGSQQLTILPAGSMGLLPAESALFPGETLLAEPSLNGEIAIASSGENLISMGTSISVAFVTGGFDTIEGGSNQEYLVTGSGEASINLTGGGDITVAAGSGTVTINAATGNNLIEAGGATANILTGSGSNTVAGGLGVATVTGGSGSLNIATLPQDGGDMEIDLGSAASTVFALSGNSSISTAQGVDNLIYTGIGANVIQSSGNDTIYSGAGPTTVFALNNAADLVVQATGFLEFVSQSSQSSTVVAGPGDLAVTTGGGNVYIDVLAAVGANRRISVDGSSADVHLEGSLSVQSEVLAGSSMTIFLSDGTQLVLRDVQDQCVVNFNGDLSFVSNTLAPASNSYVALGSEYSDGEVWSVFGSSAGNDTINTVLPATLITTSGANNTVGLGGTNATVCSSGSFDLLVGYGGSDLFSVTGSQSRVLVSKGFDTVYAAPGSNSIGAFFFGVGGGQLDFINQSTAAASVTGGADGAPGSVTVFGGPGGGYYEGGLSGNNLLIGGSGTSATTLIGAGVENFLSVGGSGSNALFAGDGNATLLAGSGTHNNLFQGGGGTDVISTEGSGTQSFFVGDGGSETITGSAAPGASNCYYFDQTSSNGGGTTVLYGFDFGRDTAEIAPGQDKQPSVSISGATNLDGNAAIFFSNNSMVLLVGVAVTDNQVASIIGSTSF